MAEVIAGAFLSSMITYLFERIDSAEIVAFFKGHKLDLALLKKLKITMITVNGLLDHAEEKQITVPAVRDWLDELKDAVYEADDLLDEIGYEALRLEAGSPSRKLRRYIFSSHDSTTDSMEVNERLEGILGLLKHLVDQMVAFGLSMREGIGEKPSASKVSTNYVLGDESGAPIRQKEKGEIISLLSGKNLIRVICVVGIGGIGKTTLARLVYNEETVRNDFAVKAWIYVAEEFDMLKIMKDILKELTSEACHANSLASLQDELKKNLKDKKFLLILDDVWNEKPGDWEIIHQALEVGAPGSKIVVTTRNTSVAPALQNRMGSVHIHHLGPLTDPECRKLVEKLAFDGEDSTAFSVLIEQVATKCKGLPLAATTLGRLLRFKRDLNQWWKIINSNVWDLIGDDLLPALKLSYYYLPSPIKRCFAYCSIFPKGFHFGKETLVPLWMAEGFLPKSSNMDLEEVGNDYFDHLVSKSFFQQSSHPSLFVMHDLIHDLARAVSGDFCLTLEGDGPYSIPTKTRHLLHFKRYGDFESIKGKQLLRSFIFIKPQWSTEDDGKATYNWLSSAKQLRALFLSEYCNETELPSSVSDLSHLRYLNLSGAPIRRLPDSLCKLFYLQTLHLQQCKNLVQLPNSMGRLINLRCLDIRGTNLRKMPPHMGNLTKLRTLTQFVVGKQSGCGIKELGKLQLISGFISIQNLEDVVDAADASEAGLNEKAHLKALEIKWSAKVKDSEHVRTVLEQLKPRGNLESLSVVGYGGTSFPNWMTDYYTNLIYLVLNECKNCILLPPLGQLPFLKELYIIEFNAVKSVGPEFCGYSQVPFGSLIVLIFERMRQWQEWEAAGGRAFPNLQAVHIRECPNLRKTRLPFLTNHMMGGSGQPVPELPRVSVPCEMTITDESRQLKLVRLDHGSCHLIAAKLQSVEALSEIVEQIDGLSSCLLCITVCDCDSLKCFLPDLFPTELFPKLGSFFIHRCPNVNILAEPEAAESGIRNLTSHSPRLLPLATTDCMCVVFPNSAVQFLVAKNLDRYAKWPASGICHLEFCKPFRLEMAEGMAGFLTTQLKEITIRRVDSLVRFPLKFFPNLEKLKIEACPIFNSLGSSDKELKSLTYLEIRDCPNFISFPNGGLAAPCLTELSLCSCSNLASLPECMSTLLPSLEELSVIGSTALKSFPDGGLPAKLQSLYVRECRKLQFKGIQIRNNNEDSESLPEQMLLPATLAYLEIRELEELIALDYEGLKHLSSLKSLEIRNCPILRSVPDCMPSLFPSLEYLRITGCPELESFLKGGLPPTLEGIRIQRCHKLNGDLIQFDWRSLPSLSEVIINEYESLESLRSAQHTVCEIL